MEENKMSSGIIDLWQSNDEIESEQVLHDKTNCDSCDCHECDISDR